MDYIQKKIGTVLKIFVHYNCFPSNQDFHTKKDLFHGYSKAQKIFQVDKKPNN